MFQYPELLHELQRLLEGQQAYLVGGAVRDMLMGGSTHDLDLALEGDTRQAARRVAQGLGGAFFVLDDERNTARVVRPAEHGAEYLVDFVDLGGESLESDLFRRDFTVNAIAVDLQAPDRLIDPTGGAKDLREGLLRACSPTSISADPIRVLRGARFATRFRWHIDPGTLALMRQAAELLPSTSIERRRDELFRILETRHPHVGLRLLDSLEALPHVLPELEALKGVRQSPPHLLDAWDHTLAVLQRLALLMTVLGEGHDPEKVTDLPISMAVLRLGRFREKIAAHLAQNLVPERSLRELLLLAALYHDAAKPATATSDEIGRVHNYGHENEGSRMAERRARALALSTAEADRLRLVVAHHMRIHNLAQSGQALSRRAVYRFFRDTGQAGVDICLLSLADMLATYGYTLPADAWQAELDACRVLLEAWWEKPEESVRPPALLNGHDLQSELGLKPGPALGRVLEGLREAQAEGLVSTREAALEWARAQAETGQPGS